MGTQEAVDHDSLDDAILMLVNRYGWDFKAMRLHLMKIRPKVKPSKLQSRFDALYEERFGR